MSASASSSRGRPREDTAQPPHVSFAEALSYWLKLGCISFGGPAGQIAIMHHDLVEKKRWISEKRFLHALNYCMVLPGPEAQQLATYIGWLMHRSWGGLIAGGLFVLPSFFLLLALAWLYMAYGTLPAVAGLLYGIKPAVVAIVLFAAWRLGSKTLRNPLLWGIAALAFLAIFLLKLPFPAIVLAAAAAGYVGGRVAPGQFRSGNSHREAGGQAGRYLIDDDTPPPAHARFSWARLARITATGLGLWLAVMAVLIAGFGWQGAMVQMGTFFTKAALLTFGGAYAVLPYVYQGAVEHYQWLTPAQMIDGLALGETTPGPLIMVITFVGFVGGWGQQVFGSDAVWLSAVLAATLVTFFTFLPSFIFIFAGAPFIESTHDNLHLTAPLTAISAAVVGVIVNLALFFAWHVFWPQGLAGAPEWPALALAVAALVAIFRFGIGVIPVILGCGALGMLGNTLL